MTEFVENIGNEFEQYLKIHSSFYHLIESYSFQSHLPYIPKQRRYDTLGKGRVGSSTDNR